jgi:pSer/pThr/pTyr-binding forkhead associated (FHA) protein
MGLLDRFEQSMERLMEGTVGTIFRQSIQPAEIGKKLERAMLSQQRASVGSKIVPNAYVVRLHPKDYAQFADFSAGLSRQMEAWLAQVATRRGFTVLDRITVEIAEDEHAGRRNPAVDASITDRSHRPAPAAPRRSAPPVDATAAFSVPTRHTAGQEISLRATSGAFAGQTFPIAEGSSTIGRSPDNTVVLNAPDVSRRHARIERSGSHLRIYDLNSTNGTRVNGEAVHISDLEPGDEILVGGQRLTVVSSAVPGAPMHQGRW